PVDQGVIRSFKRPVTIQNAFRPGSPSAATPPTTTSASSALTHEGHEVKAVPSSQPPPAHDPTVVRWPCKPVVGRLRWHLSQNDVALVTKGKCVSDQFVQFAIHYALRDPYPFGLAASITRPKATEIMIFDALIHTHLRSSTQRARLNPRPALFTTPYLLFPIHHNDHWFACIVVNPHLIVPSAPAVGQAPAPRGRGEVRIQIHPAKERPAKKPRGLDPLPSPQPRFGQYPPPGTRSREMPLPRIQNFLPLPEEPSEGVVPDPSVRYDIGPEPRPSFCPKRPTLLQFDSYGRPHPQVKRDIMKYLRLGYTNRLQISFLLNHPEERVTEAVPTEEEILEAVLDTQEEETEQDIVDRGGWKPKPKVKAREALKASRILEQWVTEQATLGEHSATKVRNAMTIIKNTAQAFLVSSTFTL
ncbi:unnamed protein product, partial [Tilletia laevis]